MTAQELGRGPAERAERSDGAGLVDLVRSVLERPEGRRWVVQDFGLVAVRLDDDRLVDSVRLTATATTYVAGQRYTQRADELHSSAQEPGTVTALRWTRREVSRLTVCRRADQPWTSGRSRPAEPAEVRRLADAALTRLEPTEDWSGPVRIRLTDPAAAPPG